MKVAAVNTLNVQGKTKRTARGLGKRNDWKKAYIALQPCQISISPAVLSKEGCIMAIVKCKPTSAGRRFVVKVVNQELHKGAPYAPLLEKKSKTGGRNNNGRITTRHIGGGHKQHYRLVDFRRNKDGIPAIVERIEYDPNRTAHIALLKYADGERRYIIAPKGVSAGDQLVSGINAPIKAGNSLPLRNIPLGSTVHGIEPAGQGCSARSLRWCFGSAGRS